MATDRSSSTARGEVIDAAIRLLFGRVGCVIPWLIGRYQLAVGDEVPAIIFGSVFGPFTTLILCALLLERVGCRQCKKTAKMEQEFRALLKEHDIRYDDDE